MAQMSAVIDTAAHRPGGIQGFVVDATTGKPLEGVAVEVAGTSCTTRTGGDGAFRLSNIFPGTRSLKIAADGMQPVWVAALTVQPGRTVQLRPIDLRRLSTDGVEELRPLYINASQLTTAADDYGVAAVPLARVVVVPSHYAVVEEAVASSSDLSRDDLELLPQKGEDLYRAMARLPGLATSETATRFWVRGAPNDQVLTRFDGVDLIEPFHVKGFDGALSIVDLDTVKQLDLITGGFTAKYGDRMAGVLTMETETFDPLQPRNVLGASLTGARAINRGEFAGGRGNWLVEGRVGYPGKLVGDSGQDEGSLETHFSDFTAKIEYRLTPNQSVSLHFLNTRDTLNFQNADTPHLDSDYGSNLVWGRWRGKFGDRVYGETVLSLAHLTWVHSEEGAIGNQFQVSLADDRDLTLAAVRQDWTLVLSEGALIQSGWTYSSGESEYTYHLARSRIIPPSQVTTYFAGTFMRDKERGVSGQTAGFYLAPRVELTSRLTIEPSVRFDHNEYTGDRDASPRFNASFAFGRTVIRGAWGIYYQSQGLHQLGIADDDEVFHPAERAEHRVLSIEHTLVSGVELRAEAYERRLSRIRPHWENFVNVDEAFPEMRYERRLLTPSSGVARGIELVAENRRPGRFHWAVSYALALAKETIDGRDLPRPRDQRHTFALDLSYSPRPNWWVSASWQYHTGWPTTEVVFTSVPLPLGQSIIDGETGPAYAQRLPAYHRLDLRVTRLVYLNKTTLRVFLDVFNAYNRKNIQGYEYSPVFQDDHIVTAKKAQGLLSFTPNLGVVWEF